jgi:hypothetical protein
MPARRSLGVGGRALDFCFGVTPYALRFTIYGSKFTPCTMLFALCWCCWWHKKCLIIITTISF